MTTEQLQWIPCNKITPNRYQPRTEFKSKELEELVLKETGFVVRYSKELIQSDL